MESPCRDPSLRPPRLTVESLSNEHLVPIAGRAPITLYHIAVGHVWLGTHRDCVHVRPLGICPIIVHHVQGQVYVWARADGSQQLDGETLLQSRAYHQQSGDILRADIGRHLQPTALKITSTDAQRREALLAQIVNVGT